MLEQYSKKFITIIRGIPYQDDEKSTDAVKAIATKLNIDLQMYLICAWHRLPSKNEMPSVIIKLNNLDVGRALVDYAKRNKLNGKDFGVGDYAIYINRRTLKCT